jgi:hypothetical protein
VLLQYACSQLSSLHAGLLLLQLLLLQLLLLRLWRLLSAFLQQQLGVVAQLLQDCTKDGSGTRSRAGAEGVSVGSLTYTQRKCWKCRQAVTEHAQVWLHSL